MEMVILDCRNSERFLNFQNVSDVFDFKFLILASYMLQIYVKPISCLLLNVFYQLVWGGVLKKFAVNFWKKYNTIQHNIIYSDKEHFEPVSFWLLSGPFIVNCTIWGFLIIKGCMVSNNCIHPLHSNICG